MALGNSPVRDMLNCGTKLNLRNVVPTDEVVIAVFGDPDWNDSSPRFYYYDANSSDTDDGENFLKPTSVMGNGRFVKITNSQAQSDWNQSTSSAIDFIKNKPTLATVATSGSYNDLSDKPSIPTSKRIETHTVTSDSSGVATVTFAQAFSVAPNVQVNIVPQANTNQFVRVSAVSTTGCIINVFQRNSVSLLGVDILLFATVAVNGATVDVVAIEK